MKKSNLKIFILAGGFGTRLKSIISDVPKPMAPILNKPFISYVINNIREYYQDEIYLLTHHKSNIIEEYFKSDSKIIIIKENNPLDTGGAVRNAILQLNLSLETKIMVINGDTYIKPDLNQFIDLSDGQINIITKKISDCSRYNTLSIYENRIEKFNDKKENSRNMHVNLGYYLFNDLYFFKDIIDTKFSLEERLAQYSNKYYIKPFYYEDIFIDIGTPEDYEKINNGELV